jgi:4-azaleucine resistance transporter AzlC
MSALVFAGSAQFITVALLQAGAGPASVVATTFAVNLRHVLMSSSLSKWMGGAGLGFLALFGYGITDESFAVNEVRFREEGWDRFRAVALNQTANAAWVASTVVGAWAGQLVPRGAAGIDYALPAMFLCLLVYQLRGRIYVLTALLAGGLATALFLWLPGNAYVILSSTAAATAGFYLRRRFRHLVNLA